MRIVVLKEKYLSLMLKGVKLSLTSNRLMLFCSLKIIFFRYR